MCRERETESAKREGLCVERGTVCVARCVGERDCGCAERLGLCVWNESERDVKRKEKNGE